MSRGLLRRAAASCATCNGTQTYQREVRSCDVSHGKSARRQSSCSAARPCSRKNRRSTSGAARGEAAAAASRLRAAAMFRRNREPLSTYNREPTSTCSRELNPNVRTNENRGNFEHRENFSGDHGEQWRYRYDQGQWWYWMPNNRWMYFNGGNWSYYGSEPVATDIGWRYRWSTTVCGGIGPTMAGSFMRMANGSIRARTRLTAIDNRPKSQGCVEEALESHGPRALFMCRATLPKTTSNKSTLSIARERRDIDGDIHPMLAAPDKNPFDRGDVAIVTPPGERDVLGRGDLVVRRIDVDPAVFRRKCGHPGVRGIGPDQPRLARRGRA